MIDLSKVPNIPPDFRRYGGSECVLCGGPRHFLGAMMPSARSPMAPPAGKARVVFFALCRACTHEGHLPYAQIEAKLEGLLRQAGAPGR